MLRPRATEDDRGDVRFGNKPGYRELVQSDPVFLGDRPKRVKRVEHLVGKRSLSKALMNRREGAGRHLLAPAILAGEHTPLQRTVRDHGYIEALHERNR